MQTNLKGLPEGEEDAAARPSVLPAADEAMGGQDLSSVLRRMKEIARVLEQFQDLREAGRSRSEYMEQVGHPSAQPLSKPPQCAEMNFLGLFATHQS